MKRVKNVRKARFRAALALTGHNQASWAAQEGVTESLLSQVLDGKKENAALLEKIESYTAKYAASVAA